MKRNIIFLVFTVFVMFLLTFGNICLATGDDDIDFWGDATLWFNGAQSNKGKLGLDFSAVYDLIAFINVIGTVVIIIATMILGIKFMISSAEGKSEVKQNLITLLVACLFFFGWNSISSLIMGNDRFFLISANDLTYDAAVGRIYNFVVGILDIVAVVVILYIGVRYIFSGASGKADLKGKSPQFVIGIILTFCTISVLTYISKVINDSLEKTSNTKKSSINFQITRSSNLDNYIYKENYKNVA